MKLAHHVAATALFALAMSSLALAQVGTAPTWAHPTTNPPPHQHAMYDKHHPLATRFGDFLNSHPTIAGDLEKHPDLIKDPAYVKSHPELATYLHHHPAVAEEFREEPKKFMGRVNKAH